jgi:chloramphenicol 3-O-phosphotransferase
MELQGPNTPSTMSQSTPSAPKTGSMGDRQIVRYDPKIIDSFSVKRWSLIFSEIMFQFLRRSLEADRMAVQHFRQYGEGKIFVLLGHSTAGKTSIIQELKKAHPEWIESGGDLYFPTQTALDLKKRAPSLYETLSKALEDRYIGLALFSDKEPEWKSGISKVVQQEARKALEEGRKIRSSSESIDADTVKRLEPKLYERMAKALEHPEIAIAIFGNSRPRWKQNISDSVKQDAQKALEEAKNKAREGYFPLYDEELEKKMEEEVIALAMQGKSVIFDPYNEKTFLARMVEKNNFVALKMGLTYCPFRELAKRVMQRNINALQAGKFSDFRPPLAPLQQFCDFYKKAEPGDTILDTLYREEVEKVFEDAFTQQAKHLETEDTKAFADFLHQHDALKKSLLEKLWFSDTNTTKVDIAHCRKGISYLFNTVVMKPAESAQIIHEWR